MVEDLYAISSSIYHNGTSQWLRYMLLVVEYITMVEELYTIGSTYHNGRSQWLRSSILLVVHITQKLYSKKKHTHN